MTANSNNLRPALDRGILVGCVVGCMMAGCGRSNKEVKEQEAPLVQPVCPVDQRIGLRRFAYQYEPGKYVLCCSERCLNLVKANPTKYIREQGQPQPQPRQR